MEKASRYAYLGAISLFLLGVIGQVFLAGMSVVARMTGWEVHIELGHLLGLFLALTLVSMYLGHLPRESKNLTWILFGVYFVQADIVIFLRDTAPILSAVHPVAALFDFAISWALFRRALTYVREAMKENILPIAGAQEA